MSQVWAIQAVSPPSMNPSIDQAGQPKPRRQTFSFFSQKNKNVFLLSNPSKADTRPNHSNINKRLSRDHSPGSTTCFFCLFISKHKSASARGPFSATSPSHVTRKSSDGRMRSKGHHAPPGCRASGQPPCAGRRHAPRGRATAGRAPRGLAHRRPKPPGAAAPPLRSSLRLPPAPLRRPPLQGPRAGRRRAPRDSRPPVSPRRAAPSCPLGHRGGRERRRTTPRASRSASR